MTKLLERAIAKAQCLTDLEQDEAAEILLWAMGDQNRLEYSDAAATTMSTGFDAFHDERGTSAAFGRK